MRWFLLSLALYGETWEKYQQNTFNGMLVYVLFVLEIFSKAWMKKKPKVSTSGIPVSASRRLKNLKEYFACVCSIDFFSTDFTYVCLSMWISTRYTNVGILTVRVFSIHTYYYLCILTHHRCIVYIHACDKKC